MPGFGAGGELAIGEVTTATFAAEFIGPDKWMQALSEPVRTKPGLRPGAQQFLAYVPNPTTVTPFGWFAPLSTPVRTRPRSPAALAPAFFMHPAPSPFVATGWFAPLSEPVRQRRGLRAAAQQFLAAPSRLLPTPTSFGRLSAIETKDIFLAGASKFNPPASAEIGIAQGSDMLAEIGVAVPTVARVSVSIIVSS